MLKWRWFHAFILPRSCSSVFSSNWTIKMFMILTYSDILAGVKAFGFCASAGSFVCESCFSERASKHTHLLPGKNSWIIFFFFLLFPNSQTLLLRSGPGSWPDYAVCLFTSSVLPSSLCSRSLFTVSGVHSRPDDAASSSPGAKTDISYSPTEFTAALSKLCWKIKIK